VTRRTVFDLRKARERGHILEGLAIALANIDEVIALIKASPTSAEAKAGLMARLWTTGVVPQMLERAGAIQTRPDGLGSEFGLHDGQYRLSEVQAQAILDLRLHRLTGLEQDKILAEYGQLLDLIRDLSDILARPERLLEVIRRELLEIREQYGDGRRTRIDADESDLTIEDLITPEDMVVTLSHGGYAKAQPVSEYRAQGRGGRGRSATAMKDEDFVDKLFVANTHDTLLCFSSMGQLYWLKVYRLPRAGRGSRGKPIVNLLPLEPEERITAVLPIREYEDDRFVFMATAGGTVKKTPLSAFSRPRAAGIIAVALDPGDRLVGVAITDGLRDVVLCSSSGKAVRFAEDDVRAMGRTAAGVRGIRLPPDEEVISLIIPDADGLILTASENGYGKLTPVEEFPRHGRGGQGVIAMQTTERNGRLVAATQVATTDELMLMSSSGTLVRTRAAEISVLGRNTQGVRLIASTTGNGSLGSSPWSRRVSTRTRPLAMMPARQKRRRPNRPNRPEPASDRRGVAAERPTVTLRCNIERGIRPHEPCIQFQRGPGALPAEVLEQLRDEMLDWHGQGMSVMEMSHRGKAFVGIAGQAEADLRELLAIPSGYKVLFLQGGATAQFAAIPLNLTRPDSVADYVNTGAWSKKAIAEAKRYCKVNVAADAGGKYSSVPPLGCMDADAGCGVRPLHAQRDDRGVEFPFVPETGEAPLVADMSSTILSRPVDVGRFGVIYAGAQKNIGPAGLVVVIVREGLLGRARADVPTVFDWTAMAADGSMLNTPATYSWYVAGAVFQWIKRQGGLAAMERLNRAKAEALYAAIDGSGFYRNPVVPECRSWMNVPFTLPSADLDKPFLEGAKAAGLVALAGHRSVGGMRASLYNAMPMAGVEALVGYMREFQGRHG
jgi:phosphoserine aminotransferase